VAIFKDNERKPVPQYHHSGYYCSQDDTG